ncbi:MAG: hypothetical protein ACYCTI_00010 [Acidimicrobiales bacterium]
MTGRRVDPKGKSALFEAAVSAAPDQIAPGLPPEGKTALFSIPPRRPGTVIVECSRCKTRTRSSLAGLGRRLASGSAWVPFRRYQHWMVCPACGRRVWCRIAWNE